MDASETDSLENVKKGIRSVLLSSKDNFTIQGFLDTYRGLYGKPLPYRDFGFSSVRDFLHSIPDVVVVEEDAHGTTKLSVIADASTAHILKLLKNQKSVKKAKPNEKVQRIYDPKPAVNVSRCRPFVPALLRSEMLSIVHSYPEGIGYSCLCSEYLRKFKKELSLEWLGDCQNERLKKLVIAAPEFKLVCINGAVKIRSTVVDKNSVTVPSNGIQFQNSFSKSSKTNGLIDSTEKTNSQEIKEVSQSLGMPESLKQNIEKVLKQHPKGIQAVHFPILYEKSVGSRLDFQELGFMSLFELADALPEIIVRTQVASNGSRQDCLLFHVCNSENIPSPKESEPLHSQTENRANQRVPCDRVASTFKYSQAVLPVSCANESFPVYVTAIINPGLFWFQLHTSEAISHVKKLEQDLGTFYDFYQYKYKMAEADILVGSSCVVFCKKSREWHRALIMALPTPDDVTVSLVDYGDSKKIPRSSVYYLRTGLSHLPAQAHRARLSSLVPFNQDSTWSPLAQKRFTQLCSNFILMAEIHKVQKDVASVFLCNSNGSDDIHINDVLVRENLAELCIDHTNVNCSSNNISNGMSTTCSSVHSSAEKTNARTANHVVEKPFEFTKSMLKSTERSFNAPNRRLFVDDAELQEITRMKNIRKILLGDDYYSIHLIKFKQNVYVSGGELSNLFWDGRGSETLANILKFKGCSIPVTALSAEEFKDLFEECERSRIEEFSKQEAPKSLSLYKLDDALKVLNCLGHPSISVREALRLEIEEFNPYSAVWRTNDITDDVTTTSKIFDKSEIHRLCLYDLKALQDGLQFKKSILQKKFESCSDAKVLREIESIEVKLLAIEAQMKKISKVCSTYS